MQYIQKLHYFKGAKKPTQKLNLSEIRKTSIHQKLPKNENFVITPLVKDLYTTQINKMNKKNKSPNFEVQELDNYFIMKTKYYSPPNFVIFQH